MTTNKTKELIKNLKKAKERIDKGEYLTEEEFFNQNKTKELEKEVYNCRHKDCSFNCKSLDELGQHWEDKHKKEWEYKEIRKELLEEVKKKLNEFFDSDRLSTYEEYKRYVKSDLADFFKHLEKLGEKKNV